MTRNASDVDVDVGGGAAELDSDALIILWISSPVLLLLGAVGNSLSIVVVYRQRHHFLAFAYYFAALAWSDLIILFSSLLPRWIMSITQMRLEGGGLWACRIDAWIYESAFLASSWFLAIMTALRASAVVRPYRAKGFFTNKASLKKIAGVAACSTLLSTHSLFVRDPLTSECYLGRHLYTKHGFGGPVWFWELLCVGYLSPLLVLLVGNILLVNEVKTMPKRIRFKEVNPEKTRRRSSSGGTHTRAQIIKRLGRRGYKVLTSRGVKLLKNSGIKIVKANSITGTITLFSLAFCLLLTPAFVVECLLTANVISQQSVPPSALVILEQMMFAKSAINWFICCMTGERFRQGTKQALLKCLHPRRRQNSLVGDSAPEGSPEDLPLDEAPHRTSSFSRFGRFGSMKRKRFWSKMNRSPSMTHSFREKIESLNMPSSPVLSSDGSSNVGVVAAEKKQDFNDLAGSKDMRGRTESAFAATVDHTIHTLFSGLRTLKALEQKFITEDPIESGMWANDDYEVGEKSQVAAEETTFCVIESQSAASVCLESQQKSPQEFQITQCGVSETHTHGELTQRLDLREID